jgi:hypothetical protein
MYALPIFRANRIPRDCAGSAAVLKNAAVKDTVVVAPAVRNAIEIPILLGARTRPEIERLPRIRGLARLTVNPTRHYGLLVRDTG